MIAVLFVLFDRSIKNNDFLAIFFLSICILFLETQKGFLVFSLLIYFILSYKYLIPKIEQNINSKSFINLLFVISAYMGYGIFYTLLSKIFMIEGISFDYNMIFYMVMEYIIIGIFL
jgi:hypothetical protein